MEKVLADIDKVIIDKGSGSGVVPYLPLQNLKNQRQAIMLIIVPLIIIIGVVLFNQYLLYKRLAKP